jgi:hypothetical protein
MVVDSTDRERMAITKEELFKMLSHEVIPRNIVTLNFST